MASAFDERRQLFTQPPDVDVDRAGTARVAVSPDVAQQDVARDHASAVLQEVLEEHEFLRREFHFAPVERNGVFRQIHGDWTETQHRSGGLASPGSARHRPDARNQLVRTERLGDVIVGANLESADAIRFLGARRQHDDRHSGGGLVCAQRLADIEAAHSRQHDVENDDVHRMVADVGERLVAGRRHVRRPAGFLQVMRDEVRDIAIVFGNENVHRGRRGRADRIIPRLRAFRRFGAAGRSGDAEQQHEEPVGEGAEDR